MTVYYAFEPINGEWVEIAVATDLQALKDHCDLLGVEVYLTIGGW